MSKSAKTAAKIANHAAFTPTAKTGYALEMWRISEKLSRWDTLFAFGFTSYQSFVDYIEEHQQKPLDEVSEILMRLYMLEPSFPTMFVPPSITDLLDFAFNLGEDATEDDRKRCISLLAPILGRNRGSGYRWLRKSQGDNPVSLPIRRMIAKVFSMDPKIRREYFWAAALATAWARGHSSSTVISKLESNGVHIG